MKSMEQMQNEWHVVFAWIPIKLKDGTIIWLDIIKRRAIPVSMEYYGAIVYEYDHAIVPGS